VIHRRDRVWLLDDYGTCDHPFGGSFIEVESPGVLSKKGAVEKLARELLYIVGFNRVEIASADTRLIGNFGDRPAALQSLSSKQFTGGRHRSPI